VTCPPARAAVAERRLHSGRPGVADERRCCTGRMRQSALQHVSGGYAWRWLTQHALCDGVRRRYVCKRRYKSCFRGCGLWRHVMRCVCCLNHFAPAPLQDVQACRRHRCSSSPQARWQPRCRSPRRGARLPRRRAWRKPWCASRRSAPSRRAGDMASMAPARCICRRFMGGSLPRHVAIADCADLSPASSAPPRTLQASTMGSAEVL
jgi:hypothetical protein